MCWRDSNSSYWSIRAISASFPSASKSSFISLSIVFVSTRRFLEGASPQFWSSGDVSMGSPWPGREVGDDVSAGTDDIVISVVPDNGVIGVSIIGIGVDIEATSTSVDVNECLVGAGDASSMRCKLAGDLEL